MTQIRKSPSNRNSLAVASASTLVLGLAHNATAQATINTVNITIGTGQLYDLNLNGATAPNANNFAIRFDGAKSELANSSYWNHVNSPMVDARTTSTYDATQTTYVLGVTDPNQTSAVGLPLTGAGATIGPGYLTPGTTGYLYQDYGGHTVGGWSPNSFNDGYVGLEFVNGSVTNFGWVELEYSYNDGNSSAITIVADAYNATPGQALTTPPLSGILTGPILGNGGFESGMTGWSSNLGSGASATLMTSTTNFHAGANGLIALVANPGTASNSVQLVHSSFVASSNDTYVLRFWAWSSVDLAKMGVELQGASPAYPQIPFKISGTYDNPTNNGGFEEYFYAFRATGNVSVAFDFQQAATYYLDDVEVLDLTNTDGWDIPMTYQWQWGQLNYAKTNSGIGWTAGDQDTSTQLPDGSVVWISSDPWLDPLNFYSNIRETNDTHQVQPRNFVMHQYGTNMVPVSVSPSSFFNSGNEGFLWYWAGQSLVESNKLKVLLTGVVNNSRASTAVGVVSLPGFTVDSIQQISSVAADDYTALADGNDGYYYIYDATNYAPFAYATYVARVPRGSMEVSSAWTFWNGTNWVADHTQVTALTNLSFIWTVEMLGPSNYAAFFNVLGANDLQFAPSPMGPWTGTVNIPNNSSGESGEINYAGNIHKETWQNGVYTLSFSDFNFSQSHAKVDADKSYYRPHYIRVNLLAMSPYTQSNYWDNFNLDLLPNLGTGYPLGWMPFDSGWTVNGNGVLTITSTNACKDIVKGILVKNFNYEADVSATAGGESGVIFRGSSYGTGDNYNGYYAGVSAASNTVSLWLQNNTNRTLLASAPFAVNPGGWYHLKVTAINSNLQVYVTDLTAPILTAIDTTFSSGSLGVRSANATSTYDNVMVVRGVIGGQPNLAAGKSVTTTSVDLPGHEATNAVDGNSATRWSSAYSDPQSITVDLGSAKEISRVRLMWDTAFGKAYQIQVSTNNVTWNNVVTMTNGVGGVDDWSFPATAARYVRMNGTQRGTALGYSLWEFEVYGQRFNLTLVPNGVGSVQLTWDSVPQQNYTIESCSDLAAGVWTTYRTVQASGATASTTISTAGPGQQFFRVKTAF